MKKNIEIGQKFGRLTVISFAGNKSYRNYWNCRCDCGNIKAIREDHLLNNKIISCGCYRQHKPAANLLNIVGKRYGKLTVVSFAYTKHDNSYWNCKCDCGNDFIACGKLLTRGTTKSCGCLKHEHKKKKRRVYTVVSDTKELAEKFDRCNAAIYNAKHKLFGKAKPFLNDLQIKTLSEYFELNNNRKASDIRKLAQDYNRSVGTVLEAKHKLFGKNISVLSEEQRKQLAKYFSTAESRGKSFEEKEVVDFIKSVYKGEIIENSRAIIAPKELDIYIPEKKFAIEYDGIYWHNESTGCTCMYHLEKTKMCMDKGIRLLHIYDYEWKNKNSICKSMILSALGIYERKEYARNCEVREVKDRNTVMDFFDNNHIQGAVGKYSLCLGLYKGEELLQAVVFGKQHFGKNNDIELYRMVTKKNTQVVGGFSKLMKHCPYNHVISYVALRLFDARGYIAGGWKIESQSQPSFCITDGVNMYSRHLFKKEECLKMFDNVTKDMTEREMQMKNGYYRLWDCGTYKVSWTRS